MSKAKLFDGPRFMNDVTNELLKTPIAKETIGDAAGHAASFDVKKVASTLDAGLKKQMDVEFQRLYQTLPSTLFKEALIKFVVFTNLLVKNGLKGYGVTVDDPNFEQRLPESAMNMGNVIIVLDKALENPEVKQAFDRFNSTLSELLKQFLQTAAFVLYAGEIGQASGDALVKGGMSALGTLPGVGPVVNLARLNSAIAPLGAKGMRAVNIASSMLDKITQKLNNVEPKVVAMADPLIDAQQQGKVLIDNLNKTTDQLNNVNA